MRASRIPPSGVYSTANAMGILKSTILWNVAVMYAFLKYCNWVLVVVWGEEEREGGAESEVGSRWEFLASCASGGMPGVDWLKAVLHRQNFILCCSR